jgi:hypothetical protein
LEGINGTISTESPKTGTPGEIPEATIWPFIMAFIALIFAALGFGSLFGWFYRKEIIHFMRNSLSNLRTSKSQDDNETGYYDHSKPPKGGTGPPVPPPRIKKQHSSPIKSSDFYAPRKQITPDIISQPMHVTINGLAV